MFKKHIEKSMDTTTATTTTSTTSTTTTTLKSKKFPTMFKKMMFSRLKNISKDATSAVKSSVQKKTSSKKKSSELLVKADHKIINESDNSSRPSTATLNKPPPDKPSDGEVAEPRPPTTKRLVGQQFNNRTYRIKTKDRKSVLSLPEVSKHTLKSRKSHLPIKVKSIAPAPPIQPRLRKMSPSSNNGKENSKENTITTQDKTLEDYQPDKWVPTAVGSARKKRLVLCYLCGKEFGTASLPFHEPQCLKKWTQENSRLPEHLKKNIPQKSDTQNISVDDWNRLAWEATQSKFDELTTDYTLYNKNEWAPEVMTHDAVNSFMSNLVPCEYCQRKFLANRLEAHTRVCIESKKKTISVLKLPAKSTMDKPKKKPTPCYVCGRLFGTASIGIHEPQCLIKWTRENDSLAPHLRRPVPTKPEMIIDEATGKVDHRATREEHWKTYLSQLVPCDRCKRTFDPDRLEVHQKSCRGITNKAY